MLLRPTESWRLLRGDSSCRLGWEARCWLSMPEAWEPRLFRRLSCLLRSRSLLTVRCFCMAFSLSLFCWELRLASKFLGGLAEALSLWRSLLLALSMDLKWFAFTSDSGSFSNLTKSAWPSLMFLLTSVSLCLAIRSKVSFSLILSLSWSTYWCMSRVLRSACLISCLCWKYSFSRSSLSLCFSSSLLIEGSIEFFFPADPLGESPPYVSCLS